MSVLHVIRPGLQTTVQDLGRWGWQSRGVSVSGVMDPWSFRIANALVGNRPDAAALEISFVGPEVEFEDRRVIAVTGAEFALALDGQPVPMSVAFAVAAGSRLRFGERMRGVRAYLAIADGIDVPSVLGSRSTHVASQMGGFEGRALAAGDRVPLGVSQLNRRIPPAIQHGLSIASSSRAMSAQNTRVRVLPGPQPDWFSDAALDTLQVSPYTIATNSDRMGFRLEGPTVTLVRDASMISDVTPLGTVQVPGDGQPILLMADRQTTGGYARIATVISADIGTVAQLGPGDRLQFAVCSRRDAITARVAQEQALMAFESMARI